MSKIKLYKTNKNPSDIFRLEDYKDDDAFRLILSMAYGKNFIARKNGKSFGFVTVKEREGYSPIITGLALLKSERGNGIGKNILNEIERYYKGKGYDEIQISALPRSMKFYEENGFRIYYHEPGQVCMRKNIS